MGHGGEGASECEEVGSVWSGEDANAWLNREALMFPAWMGAEWLARSPSLFRLHEAYICV